MDRGDAILGRLPEVGLVEICQYVCTEPPNPFFFDFTTTVHHVVFGRRWFYCAIVDNGMFD